MVIEKTAAEIISVSDLLPASAAAAAAPSDIAKIEGWLKMLDKGISLADRGVTLLGKADGIVKNIANVAHHRMTTTQPQQQIIYPQPPAAAPAPAPAATTDKIGVIIDGKGVDMTAEQLSQIISERSRPAASLVTAEQISGILGMLLHQSPELSVKDLQSMIDRNPDAINRLIAFGSGGI